MQNLEAVGLDTMQNQVDCCCHGIDAWVILPTTRNLECPEKKNQSIE